MNKHPTAKETGYVPCPCLDCFEITIVGQGELIPFCSECEEAGCELGKECSAPNAYGVEA